MHYVNRLAEKRIQDALQVHPVLVLTGARQIGKSSLLSNAPFLEGWRYLTLDDVDVLEQAENDPKTLLADPRPTIVDEVQRCPDLFLTVKLFVDQSDRKRQFILSGSGHLSLRQKPRESLAGRAIYLQMTPLGIQEEWPLANPGVLEQILNGVAPKLPSALPELDYVDVTWRGRLPRFLSEKGDAHVREIMTAYVDTYLYRDFQGLLKVQHPQRVHQLMKHLAAATGWESNQVELGKTCQESQASVSRYMTLLKEMGLLYDLRGYYKKDERAYRQPKYYWFDSGIAAFLAGIQSKDELRETTLKGRFFENLIFQELLYFRSLQIDPVDLYYWKLKQKDMEVDFILEHQNQVIPIEVKSASSLRYKDVAQVKFFLKNHPEAHQGMIVYTGQELVEISEGIYAVPFTAL